MQEFAIARNQVQWLVTGFLLLMGAFTPLTANIIQWFKSKTITLITLAIFTTGSLICGLAPNFHILFIGRMIQAIAAAFTVPILINTIFAIYPSEKRGQVMGLVTMMFTVAPAIGPTLSGFIIDHFGWHYLFFLPLPFLGLAFFAIARYFNIDIVEITKPKIDILSAFLSILGFGGLVFSISNYSYLSFSKFLIFFISALIILIIFIKRQFKLKTPLINLHIINYPQFRFVLIILFLAYFIFLGLELLMPMYIQQILLLSATIAGLVLFPASLMQAFAAPILGLILDRKGGRAVALPGLFFMILGIIGLLYCISTNKNPWAIAFVFAIFALSISCAITTETHALNSLPRKYYPHGTAIITALTPLAGALGGSFFIEFSAIIEHHSASENAQLLGFKSAIALALLFSIFFAYFANKIKSN